MQRTHGVEVLVAIAVKRPFIKWSAQTIMFGSAGIASAVLILSILVGSFSPL